MKDLVELIERAAQDPDFLAATVPSEQLQAALGMQASAQPEIAQALQARISHASHKQ
jgi:hypothetical protein